MQARPFKQFLTRLSSLTRRQREHLLALLLPAARRDKAVDLIEQTTASTLACAGCHSRKMCILVARDRTGQTLDWVPGKGPVTRAQLHEHLLPRLARDVLLVTDAHAAYRAFARQAGITHEAVNLRT